MFLRNQPSEEALKDKKATNRNGFAPWENFIVAFIGKGRRLATSVYISFNLFDSPDGI